MKLRIENLATLLMIAVILLSGCSGCEQKEKKTAPDKQLPNDVVNSKHDHHSTAYTKVPEALESDTFFKSIVFPKIPPHRPYGHYRTPKNPFAIPVYVKNNPDHFKIDENGFWYIQYPKEKKKKLNKFNGAFLPEEDADQEVASIVTKGLDTLAAITFLYEMGGMSKQANLLVEQAYIENPNNFYILIYWSKLHAHDKPGEAEAGLRRAVRLRPDSILALYTLGQFIVDNHPVPHEAIPYLEKAYRLNTDWYGPILALGEAYFGLRKYNKALKYFQAVEVITGGPGDVSSEFISAVKRHLSYNEKENQFND